MAQAESIDFQKCFDNPRAPTGSAPRGPFKLPNYQRDFAWDTKKIITLWGDMLQHSIENSQKNAGARKPFFLGTIVTQGTNPINLVDGQQRFTALTIIASAIRDSLITTGKNSLAWKLDSELLNLYNNTTSKRQSCFTPFDKPPGSDLSSEKKLKSYRKRIVDIDTGLKTLGIGNIGDLSLSLSGTCNWSAEAGMIIIVKDVDGNEIELKIDDRLRHGDTPNLINFTPALVTIIPVTSIVILKKEVKWPNKDVDKSAVSDLYDSELRDAYRAIRANVEHFFLQEKKYTNPNEIQHVLKSAAAGGGPKSKPSHTKSSDEIDQKQQLLDIGGDIGKSGDIVKFDDGGITRDFLLTKDIKTGKNYDRLQLNGYEISGNAISELSTLTIPYGGTPTGIAWISNLAFRQENLCKLITHVEFSRVHFTSPAEALKFFTRTNDSARMSSLTIFDLMLAFTEEISGQALAAGYNIGNEWKEIRKNIYTSYGNNVSIAVDFFYQWMMASKRWNGNKRWEEPEMWTGLNTEFTENYFDKYTGWKYPELLEVYKELHRYSKIFNDAKKPKDISLVAARRNERVYLEILRKAGHKQHYPTYMAISDAFNQHSAATRNAVIEEHLKSWIYVYLRYHVLPDNCRSIDSGKGYSGTQVHSKVVGKEKWVYNIHEWVKLGVIPTGTEVVKIKNMPRDLEPTNKTSWPWVVNHAKYKEMNGVRVLIYAHERALHGVGNRTCSELFAPIQIEHILPQKPSKWGKKWYDATTKKPKQIHENCVGRLGNMILLEDTINSHCSNLPLEEKFKGGESDCKAVSSHIEDSNTKTAKQVDDYYNIEIAAAPLKNVKWNKAKIRDRSKNVMNEIIGYFY